MKKFLIAFLVSVMVVFGAVLVVGTETVQAGRNPCPPGECEPTYEWQEVSKVKITEDHWVCPSGYDEHGGTCRKKVDDYAWQCPSGYSPTGSFPNGDHACKKSGNKYKAADWVKTGWHWEYADKVNNPTYKWVCPVGSEPQGSKCKMRVQTGWNCNCGSDKKPDGNGNCVPKTCEDLGNCPPPPPTCTLPQILNEAGDACVDPPPPVCVAPQVLNEAGDACIDPSPLVCIDPQVLNDEGTACVDPSPSECPDGQVGYPDCHVPTCEDDPALCLPLPVMSAPVSFLYPNFQNEICDFCADPIWSLLVPLEEQLPGPNEVTQKLGGTLPCGYTDESHNGVNDGGNWHIVDGQWQNIWGDFAASQFNDWYALPETPFCGVWTDKDSAGNITSVDANGKAVQVFHPAVLEANGYIWLRGIPDDAIMLYGSCTAGEVYNEADLLSGKLRRLRDGPEGGPKIKVKTYTSPSGRPFWNNR